METVLRTWTVASWLVAGFGDDTDAAGSELTSLGADVVLLQSLAERGLEMLAAAVGMQHRWALSHYPRSRLFPGSAVGLGVLTPHRVSDVADIVTSETASTWSRDRRVMQIATIERADGSGYAFRHAVGPMPDLGPVGAPLVSVHPARIDGDAAHAIDLPDEATLVSVDVRQPVADRAGLLVVSFVMPWVQGDFAPVG